jgi:energy-coupling factor transporter ATP-binding protein EcfA2
MKTTDPVHICPYTGLRSFTEEESLYFKGRDLQVDQITALLEQNKFLMVTGASGEGKSSLLYGGLIPNARAGFFKAKYTNWVVADFRPERNPVVNMAKSLAGQFKKDPATIEIELRRGYSSLIDLYTNSEFYTGEEDETWSRLPDTEKKEKKRKAANLLILVDQFEEFFTNPENFFNEVPSKDSQIVVNLVLETARIAMSKNLPVYVVCTMRSDYIGQCSAFRGLPEYIGFSQFFVPRLKRKDLKQVIEEPAILSGNRISQRLIERLVFDIAEGVDQLPILQHALSRIWLAADLGREEMDLFHYAMVGGMPADELPDEDMPKFMEWFNTLPEGHRKFYSETGLNKIIEIHANLLYEDAWVYYNKQHPGNEISQQNAKRIVALTFSCLTKIDNSRAVRNRMSLSEITGIINRPELTTEVVGGVLNIFREEGNSFIRPFKSEDPSTHSLSPSTVLDITHESLIRNWNKLNQWASREFEYYSTFLDFQKQLDRWKKSGKSSGYLLPIGPLTYFENWYNNCRPNKGWIKRYAETMDDQELAMREADQVLADTKEFLKKSARKEMITRAFMKYGPQRIATFFAIGIMLGLTGFYWYDADQKKNEKVIERVRKESFVLLKSKDVNITSKAIYLLAEERYTKGSLIPYLGSLEFKSRISLAIESYKHLLEIDKTHDSELKNQLLDVISNNLQSDEAINDPENKLNETNKFLILLAMDQYYLPADKKKTILHALSENNIQLVGRFFRDKKLSSAAVPLELNMAIQMWLTVGKVNKEKLNELLQLVSPLSGPAAESMYNLYYPIGNFEPNGRTGLNFNGGFHTLASLFAAAGDLEKVEWCFNKMLENNQRDYFELPRILNNHMNIIGYLYQFGHRDKVPALLQWINVNTNDNPPLTILRNTVLRAGYISHIYSLNYKRNSLRSTRGYLYPNLYFTDRSHFDAMMEDYEKVIMDIKDPSERAFTMAMNGKRKAMFYFKYWYDRQMPLDSVRLDNWLKQALDVYAGIDSRFLEGEVSSTLVYYGDGVRTSQVKMKDLFIYPDYRDGWFSSTYHGDYFYNYLSRKGYLPQLYKNGEDLQALHFWIAKAHEWKDYISPVTYANNYPLPYPVLEDILGFIEGHPEKNEFDPNLLYLIQAEHAFNRGDTVNGLKYYNRLEKNNILRSSNRYEYAEKTFFLNMLQRLCIHLAEIGKHEQATSLAETFAKNDERIFPYIYMAEKVYRKNASPVSFVYLDSAYANAEKIDYSVSALGFSRGAMIRVLSEIGSKRINNNADELLREFPGAAKFTGIIARVKGISGEGNYYRALTALPATLTETQDLVCRIFILLENCKARERGGNDSSWKAMDNFIEWNQDYIQFIPN